MKKCRLELLLYEILHLRESLVGPLAFFILVLNQGGPVKKITLYLVLYPYLVDRSSATTQLSCKL